MPLDLDKLSNDLEDALERARLLAERRRQAQITPVHMLYVLLDNGSSLAAVLDKSGVSCGALLDSFAARLNKEPNAPLEAGRRPTASRSLRNLIERSFQKMTERGSEVAEPIDFLLAAVESSEEDLRGQLRESGLTPDAAKKAVEQRAAASEALGEKPRISKDGAPTGTKVLERFGRDLTALAKSGELMPVVGREDEIRRVIQTLLRKTKNNPVLVGDPGTGKTAIAEGLALRIIEGDVPESLKKCRVVALDLTAMVAGAKYRGEFEERIKTVVDEVRARKGEIVLFLDELHSLVGAGGTEGGMDAANILKPALARGELRCVGATTFDEYREKIEKDGALSRRFELVAIKEPTDETMMVILRGIRPRYEAYHGVRLTEEALQASVKLTRRYMRSRFLPDKAIDVLDEAAARIRMQKESRPTHIDQKERLLIRKEAELEALRASANTAAQKRTVADLEAEVARLKPEVEALVSEWKSQREASDLLQKTKQAIEEQSAALQDAERRGDVAKAAEIRYGSLKYLEQQREDLERRAGEQKQTAILSDLVRPEDIAEVISERVGVPVQRMLESERERLLKLEERIGSRVFGQDAAVSAVSEAARRMRADLQPGRKPTSFLFDDETALIRIDMGEYKDKSSTSGLIGSRPGLVGSDEGGFLTEQVRRSPYSVVLFDEIEKAHPEVLDLLLGVLDEGRLTDAKGRFCDFSNTLILFTSNLGVREAMAMTEDPEKRREIILTVVKETLRPELYNRISQVIAFNSLTDTDLERIVRVQLDALGKKLLEDRDITLEATPEAVTYLGKMSWDPAYGARPVGRTMQQLVLSPAATAVLSGEVSAGDTLQIVCPDPEQGLDFQVLQGAAAAQ